MVPSESDGALADTVVLNVGGVRFETSVKTLLAVPGSRLEALAKSRTEHVSYRRQQGDYFFDRHPGAFESVLQFHRTGSLHVAAGLCGSVLKQELRYWAIDDALVEQCCWDHYSQNVEKSAEFDRIEKHFNSERWTSGDGDCTDDERPQAEASRCRRLATSAWLTLHSPAYSKAAKVFFTISAAFTIASVAIVIAESHCSDGVSAGPANDTEPDYSNAVSVDEESWLTSQPPGCAFEKPLRLADLVVFAYFLAEFLLRVALAPRGRQIPLSSDKVIDLICIVAQAATTAERYAPPFSPDDATSAAIHSGFRWLRMLQLLRVFKLLRHSVMAKVLMYTVLMSLHELAIVNVFLASFVVFFACLAHYVETDTFPSISYACWWAFITLTTVGYGDVSPKTTAGYIVGSLCALCGIFALAFTVPVVVSNFNVYYNHVLTRRRWRERCKRARFSSSIWKELPLVGKRLADGWPSHIGRSQSRCREESIG